MLWPCISLVDVVAFPGICVLSSALCRYEVGLCSRFSSSSPGSAALFMLAKSSTFLYTKGRKKRFPFTSLHVAAAAASISKGSSPSKEMSGKSPAP